VARRGRAWANAGRFSLERMAGTSHSFGPRASCLFAAGAVASKLMRIQLLRRYDPGMFTLQVLRDEFGIASVRGPRGVPNSLSAALNE